MAAVAIMAHSPSPSIGSNHTLSSVSGGTILSTATGNMPTAAHAPTVNVSNPNLYGIRSLPPMDFDQSAFLQPLSSPPRRGSITDPMLHAHTSQPPITTSESRRGSIASITNEPLATPHANPSHATSYYSHKPLPPSRRSPSPPAPVNPYYTTMNHRHTVPWSNSYETLNTGTKRKTSEDHHPDHLLDPHTASNGEVFYGNPPASITLANKRRSSAFSDTRLGTLSIGGSSDSRRDSLVSSDRRGSTSSSYSSTSNPHPSPYGPWPTPSTAGNRYTFPPAPPHPSEGHSPNFRNASGGSTTSLPLQDQLASFDFPAPSRRPSLPSVSHPVGHLTSPTTPFTSHFEPHPPKIFGGASTAMDATGLSSGASTLSLTNGDLFNKDTPYSRSPELRVSHKLAERKRRKEMKELFEELRDALPSERGMKNSKWEILSKSIDYIGQLKDQNEELIRDNEFLRSHLTLGPGPIPALHAPEPSPLGFQYGPPAQLAPSPRFGTALPNNYPSNPSRYSDPHAPPSPRQPLQDRGPLP